MFLTIPIKATSVVFILAGAYIAGRFEGAKHNCIPAQPSYTAPASTRYVPDPAPPRPVIPVPR
jgi:hypothetical protein